MPNAFATATSPGRHWQQLSKHPGLQPVARQPGHQAGEAMAKHDQRYNHAD